MAVNKKNIMTRYFFVILIMALIGVAIVVKAGVTMFAERQYWQDVADRFVKENVTVKPNRGNIISSLRFVIWHFSTVDFFLSPLHRGQSLYC